MKRIIALLLALLMISVIFTSCGNDTNTDVQESDEVQSAEADSEQETTEAGTPHYDGVFQAGFGRKDITPNTPIPLNTGVIMNNVLDPLYVSAIAVYDGKDTALIITADIKNLGEDAYLALTKRIKMTTGVPENNIMFSATHNHSAPTPSSSGSETIVLRRWSSLVTTRTVEACEEAIADLADAEIYIGTFKTTGMAFVRRYILEDGSFADIMTVGSRKVVAYESEADDTAQLIRFVRAEKKDILLANWQCHVASMIGIYPSSISADLPYFFRREVENGDDDLVCAYYQGASGNINSVAKVSRSAKYRFYPEMCAAFGEKALEASRLDKMTKIEAGKIYAKRKMYTAPAMKYPEDKVNQAIEAKEAGYPDNLLKKYGFSHWREVDAVAASKNRKETVTFYISAMKFGDLSFVAVPYEMYDTNGMYVKENSEEKMTFVLTCAGGAYAYVASTEASKHGGYDAYKTFFAYGTGDAVAEELVEMLKKLK